MIHNYERKFGSLLIHQGGACPIARSQGVYAVPSELHHARMHDKGWARKKYPLFIDSIANLMAVNHDFHMNRGSYGQWTETKVAWFEARMRNNPKLARKWNCEVP
jgi:hypothetical protein